MKIFSILSAAVLLSATCAAQEKYIIEGSLQNVSDSVELFLFEQHGKTGQVVARDTIIDGKFRMEVTPEYPHATRASISNYRAGILKSQDIWVKPQARIFITGEGIDASQWKITGNVPEQKTANALINRSQKEYAALAPIQKEKNECDQKYYSQERLKMSDEQTALLKERRRQLSNRIDSLYKIIEKNELQMLYQLPIDAAWLKALEELTYSTDTLVQAGCRELVTRMSTADKASDTGTSITTRLFPPQKVKEGDPLPDITVTDTTGTKRRLQELGGKYLLLDFWTSACGPCILSIPEIREIAQEYQEQLHVVSISCDREKIWKNATKEHNITWHNFNDGKDGNGIFAIFDVQGYPTYFIISPDEKILQKGLGYSKGSLKKFVQEAIHPNAAEK